MNDREYERLRKGIEEEYRLNLDALERVYKWSKKHPTATASNGKRGNLLKAARNAVNMKTGIFKLQDIEEAIKRTDSEITIRRPSLSSALLRLVEDGILEVVDRGSGRKGSTYRNRALSAKAG
jgi:hypothetical protein